MVTNPIQEKRGVKKPPPPTRFSPVTFKKKPQQFKVF